MEQSVEQPCFLAESGCVEKKECLVQILPGKHTFLNLK